MKKIAILFLFLGTVTQAQIWERNLDAAIDRASLEGKLVLLLFSVPDNCDRCGQLEKEVFATPEFVNYATENFVLSKPDFTPAASPETKADNLLIVEKYNKDGFFPLVVILDKSSKVLGKVGIYNGGSAREYIQSIKNIAKR